MNEIDKIMNEKTAYELAAEFHLISAKQLATLQNVSIATANRKIKVIKERFMIDKYQKINLLHYCQFYDLDVKSQF
jgi:hypothetical protein